MNGKGPNKVSLPASRQALRSGEVRAANFAVKNESNVIELQVFHNKTKYKSLSGKNSGRVLKLSYDRGPLFVKIEGL